MTAPENPQPTFYPERERHVRKILLMWIAIAVVGPFVLAAQHRLATPVLEGYNGIRQTWGHTYAETDCEQFLGIPRPLALPEWQAAMTPNEAEIAAADYLRLFTKGHDGITRTITPEDAHRFAAQIKAVCKADDLSLSLSAAASSPTSNNRAPDPSPRKEGLTMEDQGPDNTGRFLKAATAGAVFGVFEEVMFRRAGIIRGPWERAGAFIIFVCLWAVPISYFVQVNSVEAHLGDGQFDCIMATSDQAFCEAIWPSR